MLNAMTNSFAFFCPKLTSYLLALLLFEHKKYGFILETMLMELMKLTNQAALSLAIEYWLHILADEYRTLLFL